MNDCQYFKMYEKRDYCPFEVVCNDDCYFSLKHYKQRKEYAQVNLNFVDLEIEDLEEKISQLEDENENLQNELNDLKSRYDHILKKYAESL